MAAQQRLSRQTPYWGRGLKGEAAQALLDACGVSTPMPCSTAFLAWPQYGNTCCHVKLVRSYTLQLEPDAFLKL